MDLPVLNRAILREPPASFRSTAGSGSHRGNDMSSSWSGDRPHAPGKVRLRLGLAPGPGPGAGGSPCLLLLQSRDLLRRQVHAAVPPSGRSDQVGGGRSACCGRRSAGIAAPCRTRCSRPSSCTTGTMTSDGGARCSDRWRSPAGCPPSTRRSARTAVSTPAGAIAAGAAPDAATGVRTRRAPGTMRNRSGGSRDSASPSTPTLTGLGGLDDELRRRPFSVPVVVGEATGGLGGQEPSVTPTPTPPSRAHPAPQLPAPARRGRRPPTSNGPLCSGGVSCTRRASARMPSTTSTSPAKTQRHEK